MPAAPQKPENPEARELAVVHTRSGQLLKGYLINFTPATETVHLQLDSEPVQPMRAVAIAELKAIYYVRTLSGNRQYKKKRYFQPSESRGKRVMVRFKDGEILCGFVEGKLPWKEGFLTSLEPGHKGFYVYPADPDGNNVKVFVVTTAVEDVRRL